MPSKKCPKCGLFNHGTAFRCDCGYDFTSEQMKGSYLEDRGKGEEKRRFLWSNPLEKTLISILIFGVLALGRMYNNSRRSEPTQVPTGHRPYETSCTNGGELIERIALDRDKGMSLEAALAEARQIADKSKATQEGHDTVNQAIMQVYEAKTTRPAQLRQDFESRCLALKPR